MHGKPLPYMRPIAIIILFLCSLSGFAQFYVTEGTLFSLQTSEIILSSQETLHQINAPVLGNGAIILNSTSKQQLTSTQAILELPTLHLKNANLVLIDTPLALQHQLLIDTGQLTLFHDLRVSDPTAIVLGTDASILLTSTAQVVYTTQIETSNPLLVATTTTILKYTEPQRFQLRPKTAFIPTPTSNFGIPINTDYTVYCKHSTPPPEKGAQS